MKTMNHLFLILTFLIAGTGHANESNRVFKHTRKLVQSAKNEQAATALLTAYVAQQKRRDLTDQEKAEVGAVIDGFKNIQYTCRYGVISGIIGAIIGVDAGVEAEYCLRTDGKRWIGVGVNLGFGLGLGVGVSATTDKYTKDGKGFNPILLTEKQMIVFVAGEATQVAVGEDVTEDETEDAYGVSVGISPMLFFGYTTWPKSSDYDDGSMGPSYPTNLILRTKLIPLPSNFKIQKKILGI